MANYEFVTETGLIVPNTSDILSNVQSEYRTIFGQDLVVSSDTPQGVLMAADTLARASVVNNNAALANQINPNVAGGVYLDAIMALTGVQREAATRTLVQSVLITGAPATVISAGTRAQTTGGDEFETIASATIGGGGSVLVDFRSVEYGPIPCAANTLTQIVDNVLGWETVNNPTAGVLGATTQSDQAARAYRNNTLAFGAVGGIEAITSAVYNVEGVNSLYIIENVQGTTQTIDGISLVRNSVWVCVDGGSDLDVAAALLENKSSGSNWNGGQSVTITEPASNQQYTVKLDRPETIQILIKVTTPNGNTGNIKSAILAWAQGQVSGLSGFVVGSDVSPFEISAAINAVYPETFVSKVEISLSSPIAYSTNVIAIAVNQLAFTNDASITVVTP